MCGIGRIADPLNISNGRGEDLAKPWGGWGTKLDPAGIFTPKAPEIIQPESTTEAAPSVAPLKIPQRTSSSTGLQVST